MSDLSPQARAIVDAARDGDEPTAVDRRRVRAAVLAQIAAGAAAGTGGAAHAASAGTGGGPSTLMNISQSAGGASGAGGAALGLKVLVGAALIGGLGVGGYAIATRGGGDGGGDQSPSITAAAPRAIATPTPDPPTELERVRVPDSDRMDSADSADGEGDDAAGEGDDGAGSTAAKPDDKPEPDRAPRATRRTDRGAATKAPTAPQSSPPAPTAAAEPAPDIAADPAAALRQEQTLIAGARRALRDGDAARALALLDDHAARFADGMLIQEREGTRILALCELGRTGPGIAARDAFLQRWPRSPMASQVRAACGD